MPRETNSLNNLLFAPGFRKSKESSPVRELTLANASVSNFSTTSSFRYDSPGAALKSTQQLNVDYSNFQNHTFFSSAQAKVQKAFGKIINNYPFDGTKQEVDIFVDGLTGFEKYVLDTFPKNVGYLNFSGSTGNLTTDGTYIRVNDFQGSQSPSLSRNPNGFSVIDPGAGPFTAEFFLSVPSGTINENCVVLQKISGTNGITIALSSSYVASSPAGEVPLLVLVSSASLSLTASMTLQKGVFEHCAVVMDRTSGPGQLKLYKNGILDSVSAFAALGQIDFKNSPLTIGSGTSATASGYTHVMSSTLSGSIDELRFWHKAKSQQEIANERYSNVFSQRDLKLSYTFNEPSGSFSNSSGDLVLDHSGNGLHAQVSNFSMRLRNTSSLPSPMLSEDIAKSPVLFPSFSSVLDLNSLLLLSASDYDASNPNLVTRLVPVHYLLESQTTEGFTNQDGDIANSLDLTSDQPGGAVVGQAQIISTLLYIMSETFDELKMFVDEFKRLLKVDYLTKDTVSDQLLPWLSNYYGVKIPNFYSSANIEQTKDGQAVRLDRSPTIALQTIQNTLWRRVFSDLPKTIATRGTLESLKATLRNLGINADGPIRIRELGGSSLFTLGDSYQKRHEIAAMIDMSGSFSSSGPRITSPFLSGSRIEPGVPLIKGSFVNGASNSSGDGLFTSGSWSFEGTYKFEDSLPHPVTQSLARILTTGSSVPASQEMILYNLIANSGDLSNSGAGFLQLWGRPNYNNDASTMVLSLTGVNIFDGDKWQVSFGRNRNDFVQSVLSSSYFLRASKFTAGGLENYYLTSTYFNEYEYNNEPAANYNLLQKIDSSYNASGSFIVVGSGSAYSNSSAPCLNDSDISSVARTTTFTGKVSGIRFWTKTLTDVESKTHARNFKSVGVEDPSKNFNFVSNVSGSFEKLRVDVTIDQQVTQSTAGGSAVLFDFSQNQNHFNATGFEASKQIIKPERFDFEVLSSDFKSGENPNKIRIRSFLNSTLAETNGVSLAPLYSIPQNEQPKDDKRVQIEVSALQALNEDIMNIFGTLDYLDNAIGSPELVFAQDYPTLRNLRRIYFNRLTDKVKFSQFFQFFKWFDDTVGDLLEQMLPYDSKFLGTSFVIEPHALERPKFIYNYYDMYLGEENRGGKELLLLQQLVANMRKF